MTSNGAAPIVADTFYHPCLECGATVHTVRGVEQPHECTPPEDQRVAIARAYWNGGRRGATSGISRDRATPSTTREV